MLLLYNISIKIYYYLIWVFSFFNLKAKKWVLGRKNWESKVPPKFLNTKNAWFHFASLGEFEQGKPFLEKFISTYPDFKIVLTFFSPSGYDIKKETPLAHLVLYLPLDTKANATKFIAAINPNIVFVTKYEFWYHFFIELKKQKIALYMVSAIFRANQIFFKPYGSLHRKILSCVSHFFVQNQLSVSLLNSINVTNVSCVGDTRFDAVINTLNNLKSFKIVDDFCNSKPILVAGSTWLKDEILLSKLLAVFPDYKLIIAPHEIGESRILEIKKLFLKTVRYSEISDNKIITSGLDNYQTLIIDNIGMLSSLYQYAKIGYIGGGFGAGIHNTLEAAAFGVPLLFGPNYNKFTEAKDLIKINAAFSIANENELIMAFKKLASDNTFCATAGNKAKVYVQRHIGASQKIIDYIILNWQN